MSIEIYERHGGVRVAIDFGDQIRVLTREKALELSQDICRALEEQGMREGEKLWLLIAGQQNGQIVNRIVGDFEALQFTARAMAHFHRAAIWAVSYDYMTGVLAWPRVAELTPDLRLAAVKEFVERVNVRAEENMEKTGQLEGVHYAAMQVELDNLIGSHEELDEK